MIGKSFGRDQKDQNRPKGARASLAGSDFLVDALDKR